MTDRSNRLFPTALLAASLLLAGCGVKGALEPPVGAENRVSPNPLQTHVASDTPGPSVTSTPTQTATSKSFKSQSSKRTLQQEKFGKAGRTQHRNIPVRGETEKPDQPFILDKLL